MIFFIQLPEKVVIGESFEVSVKFTNPLSEKLTGGVFHIEAPGLIKSLREPHRQVFLIEPHLQDMKVCMSLIKQLLTEVNSLLYYFSLLQPVFCFLNRSKTMHNRFCSPRPIWLKAIVISIHTLYVSVFVCPSVYHYQLYLV